MSSRAIIERYHHALAIGDFDTVIALHAPDVVVWMCGQLIVSGRFQGCIALFEHMRHHVLGPLKTDAEEYVKGARFVAEEGDYVTVIFHGGLPNKTGGRYDQFYLQIFRMGDGVIQEIVEIFDTVMFEEAVAGHHRAIPRDAPASPLAIAPPLAGGESRTHMATLADDWLAALASGDVPLLVGLMTRDATLEVSGTTPLSGVASFDEARLMRLFPGSVDWSRRVCTDRMGSVLLLRSADPAYPQQYGVVLEADGDRIGRISIFLDTVMAEALLFDNPIEPETTRSIMPDYDLTAAFAA